MCMYVCIYVQSMACIGTVDEELENWGGGLMYLSFVVLFGEFGLPNWLERFQEKVCFNAGISDSIDKMRLIRFRLIRLDGVRVNRT